MLGSSSFRSGVRIVSGASPLVVALTLAACDAPSAAVGASAPESIDLPSPTAAGTASVAAAPSPSFARAGSSAS
jgi:hypothetical protein